MAKKGDKVKKKVPITKVKKKIIQPVIVKKKEVPLTARAQKIKASQATIDRLKKEYGLKSKPKPKPKKKSILSKIKRRILPIITPKKAKPKVKRKVLPVNPKKLSLQEFQKQSISLL